MRPSTSTLAHALAVVCGFTLLYCWLFASLIVGDVYLAESDLYDWFLPLFLAPIRIWSGEMYAGMPSFADTSDSTWYPVHFLFARVLSSWTGYVISAYVLGSCFMYAYVFRVTRSRLAAVVAGVAFGLSEAMIERQAHINIVHAIAWVPAMVLAVDHLIVGGSRRWIAAGAAATACCFLAGHPQPLVYAASFCVVYALAGGAAQRAPAAAYGRVAAMFLLAAGLMAVKAVPFAQAAGLVARDSVGFERFTSPSHAPAQMLGVLFPRIEHNGRETPLYVGLAVLPLALLGVRRGRAHWRSWVWLAAGIFALMVGAGPHTPAAALAYHVPLYDRFRIVARMLYLFALSAAALAGFGVAALQHGAHARRRVAIAAAALVLSLAAGAALIATGPASIAFEPSSAGVAEVFWKPFGLAALAIVAIGAMTRTRWFAPAAISLTAIVAVDLATSYQYRLSATGLQLIVVTPQELRPSVHATKLARLMAPQHMRALAVNGTARDAVVPAGFARLWNIPIAGGNSPILLGTVSALAEMGGNGDVRPRVLAYEDRALDLLSVKYILVREDDFPPLRTFDAHGVAWEREPLDLAVGAPACGDGHPRARAIELPPSAGVSSIAIVAHLRCGEDEPQGSEIGRLDLIAPDGTHVERPLRAGVDMSDRSLLDPSVIRRAQHGPVAAFPDPELEPQVHLVRFDLPRPVRGGRLVLHGTAARGWLTVERLTALAGDRSIPLSRGGLFLGDRARWRETTRFRTSRGSDRIADEDAPGELGYTVFENLRALPRAWIAPATVALEPGAALAAIRTSQLPDGRPFDPRRTALVEPGFGPPIDLPEGPSRAEITRIEDGRIHVDVSTSSGGMLVVSETHYPGWRARVGDQVVPVHRVYTALQGVVVPGGRHTVILELVPASLYAGAALSAVALAVTAALLRSARKLASPRSGASLAARTGAFWP